MSKDLKAMNCPRGLSGGKFFPLRQGEPPMQMRGQECVCVQGRARRPVWLEQSVIEMKFHAWLAHLGLSDTAKTLEFL